MIRENTVKKKLKNGEVVIGTFAKFTDPSSIEILGLCGFDFFVLDTEHVLINEESIVSILTAADATGIIPIIRVRENNAAQIMQALDAGALGVQIPQVNTKQDAIHAVESTQYAPAGNRGFAPTHRAAGYGLLEIDKYVELSNENSMVVCYCETFTAVKNLDEILSVKGIDVIFIGPMDMSASLDQIGHPEHPLVAEKINEALLICKHHNVPVGTIASDVESAVTLIKKGYTYITISSDQGILGTFGRKIANDLRLKTALSKDRRS